MASTSKTWTGSNSWVSAKIEVKAVSNPTGNYSDVTAILYGARNDGGASGNSSSNFFIEIEGSKTTRKTSCTVSGTGWTQVHEHTARIYHNEDGNKTITIKAGGGIVNTTFQMGTQSLTLALDSIALKSTLVVSDGTLHSAMVIGIDRQNESYTDTISYKCGDVTEVICEKTSEESFEWIPPLGLASQNTKGSSVAITFTIETFNGETSLGTSTKTVNCKIPMVAFQEFSVTLRDFMEFEPKYGAYVQGKSILEVEIVAEGSYGASIVSISTTVGDKTYHGSSFIVNPLQASGEIGVKTTVKDSRGTSATVIKTINVLPYEPPKLEKVSAKRCGESGLSNPTGDYLNVRFDAKATPLNEKNCTMYTIYYKKVEESAYEELALADYTWLYEITDGGWIFKADKNSSYDIAVVVKDDFGSFRKNLVGSTVKKNFSIPTKWLGFAIGKLSELSNVFEVAFKTLHLGGLLYQELPDLTDCNEMMTPNTYIMKLSNTYYNVPTIEEDSIFDVIGEEGEFLLQRITQVGSSERAVYERSFVDGTWGEWRHENPKEEVETEEVLYEKDDGEDGTVWIGGRVENYKQLEIFYMDNNGVGGGYLKVAHPYPSEICLSLIEAGTNSTQMNSFIRRTRYKVNPTSLSPYTERAGYIMFSNGSISYSEGTNYIKITKVVGHKQ